MTLLGNVVYDLLSLIAYKDNNCHQLAISVCVGLLLLEGGCYISSLVRRFYQFSLGLGSNTSYRHCKKFPIHGTGQGSENSPMIWCFISSILFDCHNQKAHGITTASPNGDVVVSFSITGFVGDSTCVTGGKQNKTIDQLLVRVKHDAQLWHDLLWAWGRKLELQECGFHLIFYDFDKHGVLLMRKISDMVITLENEKGEDIEIRIKKIDKARKNLGHCKEPEEIEVQKQFSVSLKAAIKTSEAIFTAGVI